MRRFALLLLLAPVVALTAAPVPPPSEKELIAKYWGKTAGQGEFELTGKRLTIRTAVMPDHGLLAMLGANPDAPDRVTMPRANRTVSGDFEVTVTVTDAAPPNKDAKHEGAWPGTRAGLFVRGGGYGIEFHLYQYHQKLNGAVQDDLKRVVWLDTWFPRGGSGGSRAQVPAGKSTYLRVTRKDKTVAVSSSFDGKEWSPPQVPPQAPEFPDEVTVGVFFGHSTHQLAAATFDTLTVEKPKEQPKNPPK